MQPSLFHPLHSHWGGGAGRSGRWPHVQACAGGGKDDRVGAARAECTTSTTRGRDRPHGTAVWLVGSVCESCPSEVIFCMTG